MDQELQLDTCTPRRAVLETGSWNPSFGLRLTEGLANELQPADVVDRHIGQSALPLARLPALRLYRSSPPSVGSSGEPLHHGRGISCATSAITMREYLSGQEIP
jgi:hypothetical protein